MRILLIAREREREILERCPPLRLLLFVFWTLDEANPLCFLPGWKRDKSKNTLPSSSLGLLCFFNFFRFLWLSLSNEHDIWLEQRGAVFWIQNNDVERKKARQSSKYREKRRCQPGSSAGNGLANTELLVHTRGRQNQVGSSSRPNISPKSHDIIFVQIAKCICLIWRRKKSSNCKMYLIKLQVVFVF